MLENLIYKKVSKPFNVEKVTLYVLKAGEQLNEHGEYMYEHGFMTSSTLVCVLSTDHVQLCTAGLMDRTACLCSPFDCPLPVFSVSEDGLKKPRCFLGISF